MEWLKMTGINFEEDKDASETEAEEFSVVVTTCFDTILRK